MAAPLPSTPSSGLQAVLQIIRTIVDKTVTTALPEYAHLTAPIVIMGSLLVALATLSTPFLFLGLAAIEAKGIESLIGRTSTYLINPVSLAKSSTPATPGTCSSSLLSMTPSRFTSIMGSGMMSSFLNTSLYFLTFLIAYCLQSLMLFSKEFTEYGTNYSSRVYVSLISGACFILLYGAYLLANGCIGFGSLVLSILVGGLVGYLISLQNYTLFGKSSINLTFVPPMELKKTNDYICVTKKSS